MAKDNFPLKKGNFWPMGQKDGNFLFWSTPEPVVTFLGLKYNPSMFKTKQTIKKRK